MTLNSFIPEGCALTAGPFFDYRDGFVEVTLYYRPVDGDARGPKRRIDLRYSLVAHGDNDATEVVQYR